MLVLSRRENESIVFPKLGISVQITRVAGRVVKLGIEAPQDVRVLRSELAAEQANESTAASPQGVVAQRATAAKPAPQQQQLSQQRHALRNRLNSALLGLQVLQANIELGKVDDLEGAIFQIFQHLSELNADIDQAIHSAQTARALRPADEPSEP